MSLNAGTAYVVLSGDSVSFERAMSAAEQKLLNMEQRSAKAGAAVAAVANRVDELRDKQALLTKALADGANETQRDEQKMEALRQELEATTASLTRMTTAKAKGAGGLKAFEERMGKASGALAAMSSALGSGESKTAKWGQAMVGIAGAFAAGGPVGAGIAAGAAAIEYLNSKMVESEKAAAAIEEQFNKVVDAARAMHDATTSRTKVMERDIVTSNIVAGARDDRESQILAERQRIAFEMEDSGLRVHALQVSLLSQQKAMVGLEGEKLEKAQAREIELRAEVAINQQNTLELSKQHAMVPDLVDAHLKIAAAAEARARAEEAAARALDRQYLHFMKDTPPVDMRGVMAATSAAGVAGAVGSAGGYTDLVEQQLMSEPEGDPNRFTAGLLPAPVSLFAPLNAQAQVAGRSLDELTSAAAGSTGSFAAFEKSLRGDAVRAVEGITGDEAMDLLMQGASGGLSVGSIASAFAGGPIGALADAAIQAVQAQVAAVTNAVNTLVGDARFATATSSMQDPMTAAIILGAVLPGGQLPALAMLAASVAAFTWNLAQSTESAERFHGAMSIVVDRMVLALEPFWNGMLWIVGVFDAVAASITPFFDSFANADIGEMLFKGVQPLMWAFTGAAWAAGMVANALLSAAAAALRLVPGQGDAADALLDLRVDTAALSAAWTAAGEMTYEQAQAAGEAAAAQWDLAQQTNTLTRSQTNVPSWYRVPLAEYRAAGGTGGQGGSGGGSSSGNAGGAVFNGPVTFVMQDTDIAKAVRKGLVKMRGVPVGGVRRSNDDDSN